MRRKTKTKAAGTSGQILVGDGTNWVSSVSSSGLITTPTVGTTLSFPSLSGTLTPPALTSGNKFLSSSGTWVSMPVPETPKREDKIFQFNVRGRLTLFTFKGNWELKRIDYIGSWIFPRTVISVSHPAPWNSDTLPSETFIYKLYGTTKAEHDVIAAAIFEFLYGEKFIEKL